MKKIRSIFMIAVLVFSFAACAKTQQKNETSSETKAKTDKKQTTQSKDETDKKITTNGKTIIPFVTHGGSGFSDTIETIKKLEPKADVVESGLSISRDDVADAQDEVKTWTDALLKDE